MPIGQYKILNKINNWWKWIGDDSLIGTICVTLSQKYINTEGRFPKKTQTWINELSQIILIFSSHLTYQNKIMLISMISSKLEHFGEKFKSYTDFYC